jgi:hypothetical protein
MDWSSYTATCAALQLSISQLYPDALIRIDLLGEGWGCSVLPPGGDLHFGDTRIAEIYGEGIDPLGALDSAVTQLRVLEAVA